MSGSVTTEAGALLSLRHAVTRFAEQTRAVIGSARRDADVLVKRAEDVARRRKSDLDHALGELKQAQAALSACRDERQAAELRGRVAAARRYADERRQLHAYAQQAVRTAMDARTNLQPVLSAADAAVGENASAATRALADISGKLDAIGYEGLGARIGHVAHDALAIAEILRGLSGPGHDLVAQPFLAATEPRVSIHQVDEEHASELVKQYGDHKITEGEKHAGDVPRPPGTGSGS